MGLRTPLYDTHVASGARMVDFGGWDMPLHYGSQLEEHHAVRRDAGMFDVSHMCVVDLTGPGTRDFLRHLLANDVAKLTVAGKALYSCMLNPSGGVIDDLIVYYLSPTQYRLVVNAGTRDKDIAWLRQQAEAAEGSGLAMPHSSQDKAGINISVRTDLAMIAVQGPRAREKAAKILGEQASAALTLKPFSGGQFGDFFVARTGYTGEDGFELVVPATCAAAIWRRLVENGVAPCGLGARDTLRLEAGMNLYGNDMDETVSPLISGLAWTVAFEPKERDFIGRAALQKQQDAGLGRKLVGLLLEDRGVLRSHQPVVLPDGSRGETTSGTFSPTLQRSIALARVPIATQDQVKVEIRNQLLTARVVKYPFVRNGKSCLE